MYHFWQCCQIRKNKQKGLEKQVQKKQLGQALGYYEHFKPTTVYIEYCHLQDHNTSQIVNL